MSIENDYVMRAIQQLAQALARVLGLRKAGRLDAAIQEVDAAMASIAGVDPRLLLLVEARAIAAQLRTPARMQVAGRLAAERAALLCQRGDREGERLWRGKAAEMYRESVRAGGKLDAEGEAVVREDGEG